MHDSGNFLSGDIKAGNKVASSAQAQVDVSNSSPL